VLLVLLSPERREAQAFREGLREAGYGEGRDVVLEWRSANGACARAPEVAADLVHAKVDVIVADTTIEEPTKFDFVINLKAAKALGIAVPESVVFRADEVIR